MLLVIKFHYSEFKYGTNLNTMGKNVLTAVKFRELCFMMFLVFNLVDMFIFSGGDKG